MLERRFEESAGARADLATYGIDEPVELLARILRMDEDLRGDVEGASVISDERNDLALAVTDPFDPPPVIIYPRAVLVALDPERLKCGEELITAFSDPANLRAAVPANT